VSITSVGRIVCRFAALAALALSVGACDLGGRDRAPLTDAGLDAGTPDAGADAGPDAGADAGPDASFRDGDAGAWVEDTPVEVTGPCDNDCAYGYNLTQLEYADPYSGSYGRAYYEIREDEGGDTVTARELHKAAIFLVNGSSSGYRQRAILSFVLDAATHDLVSGDALVNNVFAQSLYDPGAGYGVTTLRHYTFSYDAVAGELAYTVESAGRTWGRTLAAPEPPIVMFNHREYPSDAFGSHSPLTAMLLAERYDWGAGGVQRVPIFSPEMERLDTVELVEGSGADTLVVRYPIDTARAPRQSWEISAVYETNDVPIRLEYGIPVHMGSRDALEWTVVSNASFELDLYAPTSSQTAELPAVPSASEPITATSGDVTLHGLVDAPADAGPHAAVVMIPGWEYMTARGEIGAVDLYAQLAQRFLDAGVVAARFDARGAGDNGQAFSEATLDDLIADAAAAVAAVQARDDVDPARVFLLTTGPGVHVAAGVAAGADVGIAGIIAIAPIGRAYRDAVAPINARYMGSAVASDNAATRRGTLLADIFDSLADGSYGDDAYQGHTIAAWQSLFAEDLVASPIALPPVLILYGAEDHLVPRELVDELEIALAGNELADGGVEEDAGPALTDVTSAVLPGLTHALTPGTAAGLWPEHGGAETVDDAAVTATTDWLAAIAGGL
jgi:alpha-beta hydrolase superfamily lysophospholipase